MREAPETPDDVAVPSRMRDLGSPSRWASATERSWSARSSECAERQIEEERQLARPRAIVPAAMAAAAISRASASVAYMRGVPRNELRGY